MKNKVVFILALLCAMLLKVLASKAQDTVRMSVYFDYGKSEIPAKEGIKLDSLYSTFQNREASSMRITGNTDIHGGHQYNLDLSDARAKSVYDYFFQKGLVINNLDILGQGKTLPKFPGADENSRAGNRRTDIEITLSPREKAWTVQLQNDSAQSWNDNSEADITYTNGIRMIIPPGAFKDYPNGSFKFNPICNADMDKMLKTGFTTMTASGEVLASAGVFSANISLRNGEAAPANLKLSKPVEVWIPVTNCACMPGNVALWDSITDDNRNIVWLKNKDSIRIERIGLKKFYVFPIRSLAGINLDCPMPGKTVQLAFRKYEAVSLKLVYPRTRAIVVGKADTKGKMSVSMLNTREIPKVYAVAVDGDENIYHINGKRFSYFKQNPLTGKYIVRSKDFRKANALKIKRVNKEEVIFGYVEP